MGEALKQFEDMLQHDWVLQAGTILAILIVTAIVSGLLTRFLRSVLMRSTDILPSSSIFINIVRVVVWTVGICVILTTCFGVNVSAVIAAMGIGGIAISLGFQDTISNMIGGLQVSIMKIVQPGDNIEVGLERGVVKDVTWRHTAIVNAVGETIVIPNSIINKTALVKLPPVTLVTIPFVVQSSGDDLDQIASDIVAKSTEVTTAIDEIDQPAKVIYTGISDFGFKGKLTIGIYDATKVGSVTDAVLRAIAPLTRPNEEIIPAGYNGSTS